MREQACPEPVEGPEEAAANKRSYTGGYLKGMLG